LSLVVVVIVMTVLTLVVLSAWELLQGTALATGSARRVWRCELA